MKIIELNNGEIKEILKVVSSNNIEFDCYEGTTEDNYIFYDVENITFWGCQAKYAIARVYPITTWSSGHMLYLTDSYTELAEHREELESIAIQ